MVKRWVIWVVLVVAAVWVTGRAVSSWRQGVSQQRLVQYIEQMDAPGAEVRLRAAVGVMELDPTHPDAKIVRAQAMVDLGRYAEARVALLELERDEGHPHRVRALMMHADSCLAEARRWVKASTGHTVDVMMVRVEALLAEAEAVLQRLELIPWVDAPVARNRALTCYLRGALLRQKLAEQEAILVKLRATGIASDNSPTAAKVDDLRGRIGGLDAQLIERCEQAIKLDPVATGPWRLMFQVRLDSGDIDLARGVALRIADDEGVDPLLAGYVAETLLNLESLYARQTKAGDVEIARRLIALVEANDSRWAGAVSFELQIAQVRLALRDGLGPEALRLAARLLRENPRNPRAMCMLAVTLTGQGGAGRAVSLLQRLNRWETHVETRQALAVAMLTSGRVEEGREVLRQILESHPRYLPALLGLAGSLVDEGYVVEAEREIVVAAEVNPWHPSVVNLRMRLRVEQQDSEGAVGLLRGPGGVDPDMPDWRDVALAGAMALDDETEVARLIEERLAVDAADSMGALAGCWLLTSPGSRIDLGAGLVRSLVERLDLDPLAHPEMPPDVGTGLYEASTPGDVPESLYPGRYLSWPRHEAMELVQIALERWPDEPVLLGQAAALSVWSGRYSEAGRYVDRLFSLTPGGAGGTGDHQADLPVTAELIRSYLATRSILDEQPASQLLGEDSAGFEVSGLSIQPSGGQPPAGATGHLVMLAGALDRGDRSGAEQWLKALLLESPWPEEGLLMAVRDAWSHGDKEGARAWVALAGETHPRLALLTGARLNVAQGRPVDAIQDLQQLLRDEGRTSEVRQMACDVLASAGLVLSQQDVAVGMFENLAFSMESRATALELAAVDVLLTSGQENMAIASLTVMLGQATTSPRWVDRALALAGGVLDADRMLALVDDLLVAKPQDPLLLLYKALALVRGGDPEGAQRELGLALKQRPQAPRLLMAAARLAVSNGDLDEARGLYRRVATQGGTVGAVGREGLVLIDGVDTAGASVTQDEGAE